MKNYIVMRLEPLGWHDYKSFYIVLKEGKLSATEFLATKARPVGMIPLSDDFIKETKEYNATHGPDYVNYVALVVEGSFNYGGWFTHADPDFAAKWEKIANTVISLYL
jgi:hypothetical protein